MPGSVTASSRASRGRCSAVGPPAAAGAGQHAVVRPGDAGLHHVLPGAGRRRPAPGGRDAARRQPRRGPRARRTGPCGCGPPGCSPSCPSARWRPPTRRGSPRRSPGSPCRRPTRSCCTRRPAASRCTSSRRCAAPPIPAARRCRPATSRPCCASASSRRPRRPGRWPAWRRRWARTSPSTCSPRRATWTPTWSWRPSTSCGGAGSCGSSGTATTSPTTCCARRPTRGSARRNAGCCTGASPRAWSCCTPTTRTRSRPSSPSSTPGAGGPTGRWPTTGGPPTSRPGRFAHAEAIRLHGKALSIIAALPPGRDRDCPRTRGAGGDGGAAQRQVRLLLPGSAAGAGALGRPRRVTGPQGLDA